MVFNCKQFTLNDNDFQITFYEKIPTTKSDRNREKQRIISTLHYLMDIRNASFWTLTSLNSHCTFLLTVQNLNGDFAQFLTNSGTSESIKSLKRVLDEHGIKVAFKPFFTISQMFPKPKDQMGKEDICNLVYEICSAFTITVHPEYCIFPFQTSFTVHRIGYAHWKFNIIQGKNAIKPVNQISNTSRFCFISFWPGV